MTKAEALEIAARMTKYEIPTGTEIADELLKAHALGVSDVAYQAKVLRRGIKDGEIVPKLDAERALEVLEQHLREFLARAE